MKRLFNTLYIFALCSLLFSSCLKDRLKELDNIEGIKGDPEIQMPLVSLTMGVEDLYKSYSARGEIKEGPSKLAIFVYQSTDSLPQKQLLTLPPINLAYSLQLDQGAIDQFNAAGKVSNSFSNYALVSTNNNAKLKRISIRKGKFQVSISSNFKHNGTVVFVYPSITKNGKALSDTIQFAYKGFVPYGITKSVDLSGYDIDLSDKGISYNVIPYVFQMDLNKIPGNTTLTTDFLNISENFIVDEYTYLQGYLGKFTLLKYSEIQELDLFDKQLDGNVYIKNPSIKLELNNSLGLPVTCRIKNVKIGTGKGTILPVNIDIAKDTFTLPYPKITERGVTKKFVYEIDSSNSNIREVFNSSPQTVMYDLEFIANYNEQEEDDNFLFDTSSFKSYASVNLPLEMILERYTLRFAKKDTLQPADPNSHFDWLQMKSYAENDMPIGFDVQIYFARDTVIIGKDSFAILDSLFPVRMPIAPAMVDRDGNNIQKTISVGEGYIDAVRYDKLVGRYNRLVLNAFARSSDFDGYKPYVKLLSNQKLKLTLGVKTKLTYKQRF